MSVVRSRTYVHHTLSRTNGYQCLFLLIIIIFLALPSLVACSPTMEDLEAIDYTPLPGDDWAVSTPEEQGLDWQLVAELYWNAARLKTIYSLLVIKDGFLIAEDYFN